MNMLEKLQKEFDDALASMTATDWKALDDVSTSSATRQTEILLKARIQAYKIKMTAQPASVFSVASTVSTVKPVTASIQRGILPSNGNVPLSSISSGDYAMAA